MLPIIWTGFSISSLWLWSWVIVPWLCVPDFLPMPSLTQYSIKDSSLLIFLQGNRCWVWLLIDQTIAVEVKCNHSKGVQCVFNHLVLFKCLQLVLLTQSCNYWSYWCYCLWRNCTVCFNLSLLLFLNTVFRQY